MTDARIVLTTMALHENAVRIARQLIDERLVACVNIAPAGESFYRWQGKVDQALEYVLLMKTTTTKIEQLRERLLKLHAYEVPELLVIEVEQGTEPYLQWIRESVGE